MEGFYEAAMQLPRPLSQILCRVPAAAAEGITEIRLRAGRPVALSTARGTYYLLENGCLQTKPSAASVKVPPPEMDPLFGAVCGYSVHTVQHAVDEGYVPMAGGHRAGVCGTAFWRLDGTMGVKEVTSINIRIARQIDVPLPEALRHALCAAQIGLIVAGEPGSGKTTVLRSAAKALSEMGRRVAVVDERCELAPRAQELPLNWDVLSGYPKHIAMLQALRGLAPDVIVCDEIGAVEDARAVLAAANACTGLVATIHAADAPGLCRRPQYRELLATGAFTHVAFLAGRAEPGIVREVLGTDAVL